MTNFGKCETCRRRKVKCDEVYPRCSACSKKGRDCHYANARDSIFVHEQLDLAQLQISSTRSSSVLAAVHWQTSLEESVFLLNEHRKPPALRLKRSRKTRDGRGAFHIFGQKAASSVKEEDSSSPSIVERNHWSAHGSRMTDVGTLQMPCSPAPALLCPQTTTSATWSSIFGFEALQLNPLGDWIQSAWLKAGEDASLDLACDYVLQSMLAFRCGDETSLARACVAGSKAVRSLRQAIIHHSENSELQNLVMAAMLHCAAEQFLDLSTNYYIPHVLGLSGLLKKCIGKGICSGVIREVASLIIMDEVNVSILWGGPSAFENLSESESPTEGPFLVETATSAVESLLVKLPRLACLVRLSAWYPTRIRYRLNAIAIVDALCNSSQEKSIQQTLEMHSKVGEARPKDSRCAFDSSFEFGSVVTFALATRYYFYRVVLCGLMQTLHSLEPNAVTYDIYEIHRQDMAAATSVGMCLDYALSTGSARPITALGMIIPLQLSYGAWHRNLVRQKVNSAEYEHALRMKNWTIENVNYLEAIWNGRPTKPKRMQKVCEVFAGGPLLEHNYDYKRCDFGQSETPVDELDIALPKLDWIAPATAQVNDEGLVDIVP